MEVRSTNGLDLYDEFEIENTVKMYKDFYSILVEINQTQVEDINNILKLLNKYNELIAYKDLIEIIPSLNEKFPAYEKLCELLIECLNKKMNGRTIGNILISNALETGRILTSSELIYDSYKQYQKVGINKTASIISGGGICGLAYPEDYSISMNVLAGYQRSKINRDNKEKARNITVDYLWVLRHEFTHISQFRQLDALGVEDELNKKLWELDLYLYNISPALYGWYHDSFSLEYDADIHGYEELISDLQQDYLNDKSPEIIKSIIEKMNNRKASYSYKTIKELLNQLFEMDYLVTLPQEQQEDLISKINEIIELAESKDTTIMK